MNVLVFLFYIVLSGICVAAVQVSPEEKMELACQALKRVPGFNMFTPCPDLQSLYERDRAYLEEKIKRRPSGEWGMKHLTDIRPLA